MALDAISGTGYNSTQYNPRTVVDTSSSSEIELKVMEIPTTTKNSTSDLVDKGQPAVSEKQIKDAISQINSRIREHATRCEFSYHEETRRVSIKVIDESTNEVIKEIPPEDTLRMIEKMWELAGILVDERR